jgi:hypothetical protein
MAKLDPFDLLPPEDRELLAAACKRAIYDEQRTQLDVARESYTVGGAKFRGNWSDLVKLHESLNRVTTGIRAVGYALMLCARWQEMIERLERPSPKKARKAVRR